MGGCTPLLSSMPGGLYQNRISEKKTFPGSADGRRVPAKIRKIAMRTFFPPLQMLKTKFYSADFTSSHRYQHIKKIRETMSVQCIADFS
jgi:hypothetical protein